MDKAGSDPLLNGKTQGHGEDAQGQREQDPGASLQSRVPKDKGWGWMCVLGAFILQMIEIGSAKSFGVLYVEFVEKYHADKGSATWIIGLNSFLAMALGPFSTSMGMRFGYRPVAMVGGVLISMGFLLSAFATSVPMLYLTYGGFVGVGMGLSYAPSIVVIAQYFEKRRALANGIAVAGSGIGNFIVPPLYRLLIGHFGLQGGLIVYSGIALNVCVCGALMRPLEFYMPKQSRNKKQGKVQENKIYKGKLVNKDVRDIEKEVTKSHTSLNSSLQMKENDSTLRHGLSDMPTNSIQSIADSVHSNLAYLKEVEEENVENEEEENCLRRCYLSVCFSTSPTGERRPMFDLTLFKSLQFHKYLWAVFFVTIGYPSVFVMLPPSSIEAGISKNRAAILVSTIGISDLVGRIVFGWFSDLQLIKRKYGFFLTIFCSGAVCMIFPIAKGQFGATIAISIFFGLFGGSYIALMPVMLVEAVGVHRLPNAFGLLVLGQGIAMIISMPSVGYIRAASSNWDISFYFVASSMVLASLFFFMDYIVKCCCGGQTQTQEAQEQEVEIKSLANGPSDNKLTEDVA